MIDEVDIRARIIGFLESNGWEYKTLPPTETYYWIHTESGTALMDSCDAYNWHINHEEGKEMNMKWNKNERETPVPWKLPEDGILLVEGIESFQTTPVIIILVEEVWRQVHRYEGNDYDTVIYLYSTKVDNGRSTVIWETEITQWIVIPKPTPGDEGKK